MGKREDIINATLECIDEEGLQSVTFAKIMKKAKVGSGTIFNYFSNKDEIVYEVYRSARLLMGQHLLAGYDPRASLYERFKQIQLNRLRFAVQYRKEYLFIDTYSYTPYISTDLRNMDDGATTEMMDIIIDGQKQGFIKEMDPRLCHQITHGIISSVIKGFFIEKYPLTEQLEQQTLEASWKAIKL
ncbi:TetR/AcrR family transcriptional regulator [Paenibacillus macerans]|uniref:TetR/AcrR family transcriptional regulator n=1 Tax=Paenibacillus macerans TaxID=44252 RepID=UPI003D31D7F8